MAEVRSHVGRLYVLLPKLLNGTITNVERDEVLVLLIKTLDN